MSNSKQEIISELKSKLKEFKSKFKTQNVDKSQGKEEDIMDMEINFDTLKNYYKGSKQINSNLKETLEELKNNIDIDNNNTKNKIPNSIENNNIENKNTSLNKDNILSNDNINYIKKNSFNSYIKTNNSNTINNITLINENKENSRKNSAETLDKKYFDFNINNFINKKPKKEISEYNIKKTLEPTEVKIKNTKNYFSFDELSINPNRTKTNLITFDTNNKNNFIKLNLTSKKTISSDRNKKFMNNCNSENFKNDNFSEVNIFKNDKNNNNYFKQNTKLSDFMSEIKTKNSKKYYKCFSLTNPIIKNDISNYNLNFLEKNNNNNINNHYINIGRKTQYKFYHNNFLNDIINSNNSNNKQSFNFVSERRTFSPNSRLNNFGNTNNFNNFTSNLSNQSFKTLYNINSINSNYNYSRTFENVKNNNLNYNDISRLKNSIQNLSEEDINKLPMTIYNEIKDLYYLIHIKFFKNK